MQKYPLYNNLKVLQTTLLSHRLYGAVRNQKNIRIFMQGHVFAVWDFMMLLKQLQRRLTCVDKIWLPPKSNNTARFINQIVVGQQTDTHLDGKNHISHFELYLQAMNEIGADTTVISRFIKNLSQGKDIHQELKNPQIPQFVRSFVTNTFEALDKPTPYVASQFFYGREDPIPQMFQKFVHSLDENKSKKCQVLKYYLKRHIQVDGGEHGPMAQKLLSELAQSEDPNYDQILKGAINAITFRIKLWDGIYDQLDLS